MINKISVNDEIIVALNTKNYSLYLKLMNSIKNTYKYVGEQNGMYSYTDDSERYYFAYGRKDAPNGEYAYLILVKKKY